MWHVFTVKWLFGLDDLIDISQYIHSTGMYVCMYVWIKNQSKDYFTRAIFSVVNAMINTYIYLLYIPVFKFYLYHK